MSNDRYVYSVLHRGKRAVRLVPYIGMYLRLSLQEPWGLLGPWQPVCVSLLSETQHFTPTRTYTQLMVFVIFLALRLVLLAVGVVDSSHMPLPTIVKLNRRPLSNTQRGYLDHLVSLESRDSRRGCEAQYQPGCLTCSKEKKAIIGKENVKLDLPGTGLS